MEEQKDKIENKTLHTLAEDMALALEKNEGGFVRKIIEEEEKKEEEKKQRALYNRRNRIYIVLAILFLLGGGVVFSIVFLKENPINFLIQKRFTPIIFHEKTEILDITNKNKDEIGDTISELILKTKIPKGEILGIYLKDSNKIINFDSLLNKLESPFIPKEGTFSDNFLLGAINREIKDASVKENTEIELNNIENQKKILDDFVTFSAKDFFSKDTTFIDQDKETKMKELVQYFLDTVNVLESKIQIFGIYPFENKNSLSEKEATLYKNFGLNLLNQILKEKYTPEEIKNITLEEGIKSVALSELYTENEIANMNPNDKQSLIDLNLGFQLLKINKALINKEVETNDSLPKVDITKPISSIYKQGTDIFMLFNIGEGKDIFGQMRNWENKMFSDLHDIFGIPLSLDTGYLLTKNFEDGIIQNKNARILRDGSGGIVMMYVYIDNNTLVITNTEEGAKEIIFRVNSSKIKK